MTMARKRLCLLFATMVLLLFLSSTGAAGSEYSVPSLFHNDEAWYKDSIAPLLQKDGRYHIPADLLSMFEEIQVSYSQGGDNVLVTGPEGSYVSILFGDKTAVVNGELYENIGVFRENGYTYVDSEWIAELFSLTCTYIQTEEGKTVLRLTDAMSTRSWEELEAMYRTDIRTDTERDETMVPAETDSHVRRIYIVTGDNYENPTFPAAEDVVANSGLTCTLFLHQNSMEEKYWQWGLTGLGGICAHSVAEADAVNEALEALCCRRLEYVLPAQTDTDREALREAGYLVIEPDFVVDYRTDPDVVYGEIAAYLTDHDQVIVQVSGDGCSQRMIALLCDLIGGREVYRDVVLFGQE